MTFEDWLQRQINRDSPLGDLAKDWVSDGKPVPFTIDRLYSLYACDAAIRTFKSAQRQWKRYCKLNIRKETQGCGKKNINIVERLWIGRD